VDAGLDTPQRGFEASQAVDCSHPQKHRNEKTQVRKVYESNSTYARSMLPSVWSCFRTLIVAAFGILVSSMTSTLEIQ